MKEKKTSVFANGLIWFGAAVSIAEILTGTSLASLGFSRGMAAIIIGHIIGCALLFAAGLIGGRTEKSAMETVKMSFGQKGSLLFSSLNVLQLVGWTAIMIVSGASAANAVIDLGGNWMWSLVIGLLIALWIGIGIRNLSKLNTIAMGALFLLTVVLSRVIFGGAGTGSPAEVWIFEITGDPVTFGAAVEMGVAMPLSWLPLISDYTRTAEKPLAAAAASTLTYFFTSCWMYAIGLGAALYTGESDIGLILAKAGLGLAGLLIIIFSTVTTTFLDAYSAGVSAVSISGKVREKPAALLVCAVGVILAIFTPIAEMEDFLYLIGSVFAPMITILIADYFVIKRDVSDEPVSWRNLAIWLLGFVLYRIFMNFDTPAGVTLPVMLVIFLVCLLAEKIKRR